MNGENSRNGLYERSGTETDGGKRGKARAFFALFGRRGRDGDEKDPAFASALRGAGTFSHSRGGDLPFFKKDDSPSSFSGANGKDEATLKAELTELLAGAEGVGKTEIYLTAGEDGRLQGHRRALRGGRGADCTKAGHRSFGPALYGIGAHRIFVGGS